MAHLQMASLDLLQRPGGISADPKKNKMLPVAKSEVSQLIAKDSLRHEKTLLTSSTAALTFSFFFGRGARQKRRTVRSEIPLRRAPHT